RMRARRAVSTTKAARNDGEVTTTVNRPTGFMLRYGLAVGCVAAALGAALLAQRLGVLQLEFPLLLLAVAIVVWYAGTGPGVLAVALAGSGYNYFFTQPLYSLMIEPEDRPVFVAFVVFALVIASFSTRRRQVERELRQAHTQLQAEVAE